MELFRQKNVATYIVFPIVDADGDTVTSATTPDSEIDAWTDGAAPDGFTDCTNEATEIGTTGIYYLSLTQTEMNNDYIYIQVKTATAGAKTQHIIINTKFAALADTSGRVDVGKWLGTAVTTSATSSKPEVDAYSISDDATAANNLETATDGGSYNIGGGGAVAASVTAAVTVGTNNDKTGYSIADATSDAVIADAVWNAATATYGAAGSYGLLVETDLDATVSSRLASASISLSGGAVTVGTNNDKTGYSIGTGGIAAAAFAAGAIDAAAIAADAITSSELAQSAAQEVADEVLNRDLAGGGSGNTRNVRNALRLLRNKTSIAAGTLTVNQEDDLTPAWTAAVTTAAGNPITEVDPA